MHALHHTNLIVEEIHDVWIQPQRKCLQKGYIIGQYLLVVEIMLVCNDLVHMIIRQEEICCGRNKVKLS